MAGYCGAEPLMRDPLYQDEQRLDRLAGDERMAATIMRPAMAQAGERPARARRGDLAGLALAMTA